MKFWSALANHKAKKYRNSFTFLSNNLYILDQCEKYLNIWVGAISIPINLKRIRYSFFVARGDTLAVTVFTTDGYLAPADKVQYWRSKKR